MRGRYGRSLRISERTELGDTTGGRVATGYITMDLGATRAKSVRVREREPIII